MTPHVLESLRRGLADGARRAEQEAVEARARLAAAGGTGGGALLRLRVDAVGRLLDADVDSAVLTATPTAFTAAVQAAYREACAAVRPLPARPELAAPGAAVPTAGGDRGSSARAAVLAAELPTWVVTGRAEGVEVELDGRGRLLVARAGTDALRAGPELLGRWLTAAWEHAEQERRDRLDRALRQEEEA
ncbi:hypothetical protein [Auraticoccus monumenti]|uniref:YbaB/EbfC DNA-binding family protein n=1 Tax=Auraticoccus monumenti TaxID=675864 RepID=A0A1G6VQP3_9ACTN|nr:hypothetical protein [Auraticoccus monumenti]SDD55844.1 hypothetical protein SAMN04489747_1229 [Auraticoccus monumenti]